MIKELDTRSRRVQNYPLSQNGPRFLQISAIKLVCKPWLDLLTTREFVKLHLSKSVPCLAIYQPESVSKRYKIIEFVNELSDEDNWNIVIINFDFPFRVPLLGSANGLLLLQKFESEPFICNPVTREYITLLSPRPTHAMVCLEKYGFGVSKMSGDYKVVRIFIEGPPPNYQIGCHVYTIGTRLWRRIACDDNPLKLCNWIEVFLDGNLHWMESKGSSWRIRSLDLETELFSSFSAPLDFPCTLGRLSALRDCLCVSESSDDESASNYGINIWLLKEYGDEKSWTKDFNIHRIYKGDFYLPCLRPIKVFEDGSILLDWGRGMTLYCIKTNSIQEVSRLKFFHSLCITTPSFLPLKTFAMENVSSF